MTKEEFTASFYSLRTKVEMYANKLLQKKVEAEDVAQEVMLKIWQSGIDLKSINNPEAYCIQMTKHLSLDRLKAKNYRWNELPDHLLQQPASGNPERTLEGNDFMEILESSLKTLPPIQRKLFEYREIEGLTYEEMAKKEDMSLASVKVYLHRARTALRTSIINATNGDYHYE